MTDSIPGFTKAGKARNAKGEAPRMSAAATLGWCPNITCAKTWAEHTTRQRRICQAAAEKSTAKA